MGEIGKLKRQIVVYKKLLKATIKDVEMILDKEVIDKESFETIRKCTEKELRYFYTIRINKMKIRRMERNNA